MELERQRNLISKYELTVRQTRAEADRKIKKANQRIKALLDELEGDKKKRGESDGRKTK